MFGIQDDLKDVDKGSMNTAKHCSIYFPERNYLPANNMWAKHIYTNVQCNNSICMGHGGDFYTVTQHNKLI
jgi:hypothetical protein